MTSPDLVTTATLVGTWVLVVGTLAFAYWQLRQARRLHSATTLLDLRERFYGARMRVARREVSRWLLAPDPGKEPDNWELAIFFELIGSLTHTGVLERRMVWSAFGPWITAYYVAFREPVDRLSAWRKESDDPLIFAEYEWLAKEMVALDRQISPRSGKGQSALGYARDVLENETHLDGAGEGGTGPL